MSCKNCVNRYPSCHDTCEAYLNYRKKCIEVNQERHKHNDWCRSHEQIRRKDMWSTHKNRR